MPKTRTVKMFELPVIKKDEELHFTAATHYGDWCQLEQGKVYELVARTGLMRGIWISVSMAEVVDSEGTNIISCSPVKETRRTIIPYKHNDNPIVELTYTTCCNLTLAIREV